MPSLRSGIGVELGGTFPRGSVVSERSSDTRTFFLKILGVKQTIFKNTFNIF
jgi:hypothetical protein